MNRVSSYTTKASMKIIGIIIDVLTLGPASTVELIEASGYSRQHVTTYLKHLEAVGHIYCLAPAEFRIGASISAVWALNIPDELKLPESLDDVQNTVDDFPQRVIIRTAWKPHHARMPMDCLLFGVPAAMQAAA